MLSSRLPYPCDARPASNDASSLLAFSTPDAPSSEMFAVDTRSRDVMPHDRASMATTITGTTERITFLSLDYFPVSCPLLFLHGGSSGWSPSLLSTAGHKCVSQGGLLSFFFLNHGFNNSALRLLNSSSKRFSCIEDERLSFHARNQDLYKTSLHQTSAQSRIPRALQARSSSPDRIVIPSSFSGGFSDHAKKFTEVLAVLRHLSPPSYFITMTCNKVSSTSPSLYTYYPSTCMCFITTVYRGLINSLFVIIQCFRILTTYYTSLPIYDPLVNQLPHNTFHTTTFLDTVLYNASQDWPEIDLSIRYRQRDAYIISSK